jgi:hypothetical protein
MSEKETEKFEKRTGKVIIHGFTKNDEEFAKTVLEVEQYLNNRVAVEIYQKSKIAIRFHL